MSNELDDVSFVNMIASLMQGQQNEVWHGRPPGSPTSLWEGPFFIEVVYNPSNTSNAHTEASCPVALKRDDCAPQGAIRQWLETFVGGTT